MIGNARAARALPLLVLAACAHAGSPAAPTSPGAPGAATPVTRLAELAQDPHAPVLAVVEQDGATFVFTRAGATIVRGGATVAGDALAQLTAPGGPIAAPTDAGGRWVMSSLHRVLPTGEVELIDAARLGLPRGEDWRFAGAGPTFVARSARHLAVSADGRHVAVYAAPPTATTLAVARGRVALAGHDTIEVWDLARGARRTFRMHEAHVDFLDAGGAHPRLVAWTHGALALEGADGALHPVATSGGIHQVAASGPRLWVLAGHALAYLDAAHPALTPTTLRTEHVAHPALFGAPSGDVWLATQGDLARYGLGPVIEAPDPGWTADVAPVFTRVCAGCHLPDGSAGVDLSTAARWRDLRAEIALRVVHDRTMPPAGTSIAEPDRDAIARWVAATGTVPPAGSAAAAR